MDTDTKARGIVERKEKIERRGRDKETGGLRKGSVER
jgi:hypothetical protein